MSRNNYRRRGNRRQQTERQKKVIGRCPICEKPIRDANTAIFHSSSKTPAHFDCVVKDIRHNEELKSNEKICYLGKGSFGILSMHNASQRFLIRKRIQYENREELAEWKKRGD